MSFYESVELYKRMYRWIQPLRIPIGQDLHSDEGSERGGSIYGTHTQGLRASRVATRGTNNDAMSDRTAKAEIDHPFGILDVTSPLEINLLYSTGL